MFRENVLIALTILITILALSFIILMTVFLQLHEVEQRLKKYEKQQEEMMNSKWQVQDEKEEDGMFAKDNEVWKDNEEQNRQAYERQQRDEDEVTTTEAIANTMHGFPGDELPEPSDALRFPYRFYGSSGHLTIEIPDTHKGGKVNRDYGNEKVLLEVMKRMQEFYSKKKIQELSARVRYYNGESNLPLGYYYPFNGQHESFIWFNKKAIDEIAPEKKIQSKESVTVTSSSELNDVPPAKEKIRQNRRKRWVFAQY